MRRMKWWVYLIILTAILDVFRLCNFGLNKYYESVGPFTVVDAFIAQPYSEYDAYNLSIYGIQKYNDVIYVEDISDELCSWIYKLQDGKVSRVSLGDYYYKFRSEDIADSECLPIDLWDKYYGKYEESDSGALLVSGQVVAENVTRTEYIRGNVYYATEESGEYIIGDAQKSIRVTAPILGELYTIAVNTSETTVCITEAKGPKKYLRLISAETGEELWRCEDGRDPCIREQTLCFRTWDGLAVYDLKEKERRDISIDDFSSFTMYDDEYIYCVKNNNDVTRIDTKTMQEQTVLISNLDKPLIKLYHALHPHV